MRLLTWRLWRSIKNPPEDDPIYQHIVSEGGESLWSVFLHSRVTRLGAVAIWTVGIIIALLTSPLSLLVASLPMFWVSFQSGGIFLGIVGIMLLSFLVLAFTLLAFSPFLYVIAFQLYAAFLSGRISSEISAARENRMHDLLCVTPGGSPAMYRAYSSGGIHRGEAFGRFIRIGFALLVLGGLAGLQAVGTISVNAVVTGDQSLLPVMIALVAFAIFFIDLRQTIVISVLVGMLTPLYAHDRANSRLGAAGVFIGIQTATYGVIILIDVIVLPLLYIALNLSGFVPEIILGALWFAVYLALREAVVMILWRRLQYQFGHQALESVWSQLPNRMPLR